MEDPVSVLFFLSIDCTAPFIVGIKTENTQDALLGDPADPTLAVIKSRGKIFILCSFSLSFFLI